MIKDEDGYLCRPGKIEEFYDIKEELGRGQFAVVKRCVSKENGEAVAAKFIKIKRTRVSKAGLSRESVEREAAILASVDHKHIIKLYDAFDLGNEMALLLELLNGGELFDKICEMEYMTEMDAALYLKQVLEAIDHLHDMNIVHLDIKPENIVLKRKEGPDIKLVDFGLAQKLVDGQEFKEMMGTPEFVAPEIVNYDEIGLYTDMWAIGVLTYVLLSGYSPFLGDNNQETYENITNCDYGFEDDYFEQICDDAKDFVSNLLIKQPNKRNTSKDCLAHPWLQRMTQPRVRVGRVSMIITTGFKAFVARRRWKGSFQKLSALSRFAKSIKSPAPIRKEIGSSTIPEEPSFNNLSNLSSPAKSIPHLGLEQNDSRKEATSDITNEDGNDEQNIESEKKSEDTILRQYEKGFPSELAAEPNEKKIKLGLYAHDGDVKNVDDNREVDDDAAEKFIKFSPYEVENADDDLLIEQTTYLPCKQNDAILLEEDPQLDATAKSKDLKYSISNASPTHSNADKTTLGINNEASNELQLGLGMINGSRCQNEHESDDCVVSEVYNETQISFDTPIAAFTGVNTGSIEREFNAVTDGKSDYNPVTGHDGAAGNYCKKGASPRIDNLNTPNNIIALQNFEFNEANCSEMEISNDSNTQQEIKNIQITSGSEITVTENCDKTVETAYNIGVEAELVSSEEKLKISNDAFESSSSEKNISEIPSNSSPLPMCGVINIDNLSQINEAMNTDNESTNNKENQKDILDANDYNLRTADIDNLPTAECESGNESTRIIHNINEPSENIALDLNLPHIKIVSDVSEGCHTTVSDESTVKRVRKYSRENPVRYTELLLQDIIDTKTDEKREKYDKQLSLPQSNGLERTHINNRDINQVNQSVIYPCESIVPTENLVTNNLHCDARNSNPMSVNDNYAESVTLCAEMTDNMDQTFDIEMSSDRNQHDILDFSELKVSDIKSIENPLSDTNETSTVTAATSNPITSLLVTLDKESDERNRSERKIAMLTDHKNMLSQDRKTARSMSLQEQRRAFILGERSKSIDEEPILLKACHPPAYSSIKEEGSTWENDKTSNSGNKEMASTDVTITKDLTNPDESESKIQTTQQLICKNYENENDTETATANLKREKDMCSPSASDSSFDFNKNLGSDTFINIHMDSVPNETDDYDEDKQRIVEEPLKRRKGKRKRADSTCHCLLM